MILASCSVTAPAARHNHGYEFEKHESGTLYDYIVQNADPQYVSFEMDILWTFFPGAEPAALLEKYPNRYKLMHLKDLRKGVTGNLSGGTPVENDVALGTGQLNLPVILKAAKKLGIEHPVHRGRKPELCHPSTADHRLSERNKVVRLF